MGEIALSKQEEFGQLLVKRRKRLRLNVRRRATTKIDASSACLRALLRESQVVPIALCSTALSDRRCRFVGRRMTRPQALRSKLTTCRTILAQAGQPIKLWRTPDATVCRANSALGGAVEAGDDRHKTFSRNGHKTLPVLYCQGRQHCQGGDAQVFLNWWRKSPILLSPVSLSSWWTSSNLRRTF